MMKTSAVLILISISIFTMNVVNAQSVPTYTVTFDLGAKGALISGDLVQTVARGGTAIAPEISVDAGSAFVGWDKHFHNVIEDLIVKARYVNRSSASIVESKVITIDELTYEFGYSLGVCGDTAIIGATGDDENGTASGCAYVFVRNGEGWFQQEKLIASDGAKFDYFGESVSLSGSTALIGASGDNGSSGSVYVFTRSGNVWVEQAKLTASDAKKKDRLGVSVSISGNTAVVGAPGSGSAYVFVRNGSRWIEQAKLIANYGLVDDEFGSSVSVSGDTIVIGASGDDGSSGSAYVFMRSGTSWIEQAKLTASDGEMGDRFGVSVSVSGDTIVIGASGDDSSSGSAYVFVRNRNRWIEQAKLTASDGKGGYLSYNKSGNRFTGGDRFGYRLSLSGDTVVIGAWGSGSAYVFVRTGDTWDEQAKLVSSNSSMSNYFSSCLSISGNTAVIIDHQKGYAGNRSGSAHFYDLAMTEVPDRTGRAAPSEMAQSKNTRRTPGPEHANNIAAPIKTTSRNTSSKKLVSADETHGADDSKYVDNSAVTSAIMGKNAFPVAPKPTGKVFILEDYDGGGIEGNDSGLFGEGTTRLINKTPGNTVRELVDDANYFGLIQIRDFAVEQDISGYRRLEFSYYSEAADSQRTIQIQLSFTNPQNPNAENLWNWKAPATLAEGHKKWTSASISLKKANFERASKWESGNEFDLKRLDRISILILRNGALEPASPVYVDNILVSKTLTSYDTSTTTSKSTAETRRASGSEYLENISETRTTADRTSSAMPKSAAKPTVLVLEDYDGGGIDGSYKGPFGEGIIDLANKTLGNTVCELIDDTNYFGLIHIKDFTVEQDISGYERLEFSYYNEAADRLRTLQIQLSFTNSQNPSAENLWNWKVPVSLASSDSKWTSASIGLEKANFERASSQAIGNEFDLTRLNRIAVLILRNGAREVSGSVYVDNILVSRGRDDAKR